MSDDNKKNKGTFDPEKASKMLQMLLEGKSLKDLEEKDPKRHIKEEKKETVTHLTEKQNEKLKGFDSFSNLELQNEKLLDEFYQDLLKKYKAKEFFDENFNDKDLSDLIDLLFRTFNQQDKQKFLKHLSKELKNRQKFSSIDFLENYLYVYVNFQENLLSNDLSLSDLEGEQKEIYENQLLSLGKFLAKQKEFLKNEPQSHIINNHRRNLKSLTRSFNSLYSNTEERVQKVVSNTLLHQFWFFKNISNSKSKLDYLRTGQKEKFNEFLDKIDVLGGDWRQLAYYTVNWEATQLENLFKNSLKKNEYWKNYSEDAELIKDLLETIIVKAKLEAKEVLNTSREMVDAEQYLQKWFSFNKGLFAKLYKSIKIFIDSLQVTDEMKIKSSKQILISLLRKMEKDLSDTGEKLMKNKEAGVKSESESEVAKLLDPTDLYSLADRVKEQTKEEEVEQAERLRQEEILDQTESLSKEEEIIEENEDYKINVNEYNFLKNVLSDEDLAQDLLGEVFEKIKKLPKVVYKQDLPIFDKRKLEKAWHHAAEILNKKINELLNTNLLQGDNSIIHKYLTSLATQLKVRGVIPEVDPVYDLDNLEKRWELYQILKITLHLQ